MDYKYPTPQLLLKAICNAIRSKTGNSDEIPHQNIPDELDKITAMSEEKYNTEIQRFIDMIEGTSVINDRIETMPSNIFANCESLTTVNLPECTSIENDAFRNCTNLTTVDLPKCTSIGSYAFYYCSKLTTIILISGQIATLGTHVFTITPIESGTGCIYVPDSLVDSYKTATNWSTYANSIKPISELPSELKEEYGYD